MIRTIRCDETDRLWRKGKSRRFAAIARIAQRKLDQMDANVAIEDIRAPPGNRLEKLKGDLAGRWSIRINDRWRICFRWQDGDAWDVEIIDYH